MKGVDRISNETDQAGLVSNSLGKGSSPSSLQTQFLGVDRLMVSTRLSAYEAQFLGKIPAPAPDLSKVWSIRTEPKVIFFYLAARPKSDMDF